MLSGEFDDYKTSSVYINSEDISVSFAFFFSVLFLESSPEFFKGCVFGLKNIHILKVTEV